MTEFRLPETGVTYPPHKRQRRRQFERTLGEHDEARRAMEWFLGFGEFGAPEGEKHPAVTPAGDNDFVDSVRAGYHEWGSLTERQLDAVVRMFRRVDEDVLQPAQAAVAEKTTKHVGEVGERRVFTLHVHAAVHRSGAAPYYLMICTDDESRKVICSQANAWPKGQTVTVRATVAKHDRHKGEAQTEIVDPAMISTRRPRRIHYGTTLDD